MAAQNVSIYGDYGDADQTPTKITIAGSVTNDNVFSMEDYSGAVLTNSQNNAVLLTSPRASGRPAVRALISTVLASGSKSLTAFHGTAEMP